MSTFVDRIILLFTQQTFIDEFLSNKVGADALFDLTYDAENIDIKSIEVDSATDQHYGVPLFETIRSTATHERIIPANTERTHVRQSQARKGRLAWIDILMEVRLAASVHDLTSKIKEITVVDLFNKIGDVDTLDQLRNALLALYPDSVVDEFFRRFNITSIDEFKQRGNLFLTFVFEQPPDYKPEDPGSARTYNVNACVLVEDQLDVMEALQRGQLCRSILENERDFAETFRGGDIKHPYAFIMIFPDSSVSNNVIPGMTADQIRDRIRAIFAAEGMFAHFES